MSDIKVISVEQKQIDLGFSGDNPPESEDAATSMSQNTTSNACVDSDIILAQLLSMGFELSVAQFAVYENKGLGFNATLQWLLQQQNNTRGQGSSDVLEKQNPTSQPEKELPSPSPKKGILKSPSQSNARSLWKRDWLTTLNNRLQTVSNNTATNGPASTTASFLANALKRLNAPIIHANPTPSKQDSLPERQNSSHRLPFLTTPTQDQIDQVDTQALQVNDDLLTPAALKRVRFSITNLINIDEYLPSQDNGDRGDGQKENSDSHEKQDDASQKQDDASQKQDDASQKQDDASQKQDDASQKERHPTYNAKQMLQFYLASCRTKEEIQNGQLVGIFRRASQHEQTLHTIDLSGHILNQKAIEPIADVLTLECGLQQLILKQCDIDDDTLKVLCHSLLVIDKLPHLNLAENKKIRSNGFNYIGVYIKKSATLNYLDLSGTYIDKKSAMFLAQALIQGNNRSGAVLETLKLDNCGLKNNVLELLGPGIRQSNLSYLSLRFNRINHVGAIWIGVMLRDYEDGSWGTKDHPLSATHPAFSERDEIKAEKLRQRKRGIETLDATGNDLRSGIQYIAQALRRNRSLRELHLLDNRLDAKDLVAFSEGLKHNHTLQLLDLSRNPLGGPSVEGIIALRNALSVNKGIRALFLAGVQLSSEGAIALAEYLPETKFLTHLDLTTNPGIDVAGIMALSVSLKMNRSLRCLDVNVPPNDNEMARLSRDILRACVRNTELVQNQGAEEEVKFKSTTDFVPEDRGSSELRIPVLIEDVKKDIQEANANIKLLEEMMIIDQQKFLIQNVEPDEMVKELHAQCQSFRTKARSYITGANDETLLADLLTLNDNLSSALQTYDSLYSHVENVISSEPLGVPGSSKSSTSTNPTSQRSSSPSITLTPEDPSFSFFTKDADGESSDESFHDPLDSSESQLQLEASMLSLDDIPPRPKSPMEELNRFLEVEEGEVLRKAKSKGLGE